MLSVRSAICSAVLLLGFSGGAISLRVDGSSNDPAAGNLAAAPRMLNDNSRPPAERLANGDWADRLRWQDFWQQMRSPQSRPDPAPRRGLRSARSVPPRKSSAGHGGDDTRSRTGHRKSRDGDTYRTMYVRLCDGYFWPVSFATARASLEQDRRNCEESCESPARLYAARDSETPLEDMKDENGRYYRDLKTAFVYRSAYQESCKCRAHPWEAEAQARHAGYAQGARPMRQR